jgi:DNA modification methylase
VSARRSSPKKRGSVPDRVVELVRVRAGELVENPKNWRRHPERQRAALRGLLREIGYADALLARRDGDRLILIDGHLRKSLGDDQMVPVLVLDLDEREADTLLATLDPLAALAEADPGALASLLEDVETSSVAVLALLDGLRRSAGLPLVPLFGDPDDVPGPPPVPRTRPGDVWLLGPHRLVCGDATDGATVDRAMAGARADLVWTDPPYGVGYVGRTRQALTIAGDSSGGLAGLLSASFEQINRVCRDGAAIYVAHPAGRLSRVFLEAFVDAGWTLRQTLVWLKDRAVLGHGDYHYQHEPILYGVVRPTGRWGRGGESWYGGNGESSVLEVPRPAASREHPTMKPVELIRRCIANSSREGDVVLDPFAGSGSTLIAAHLSGRRCVAAEIDPAYCDVIVERFERVTGRDATRDG